jgi:hypothetical protein
MPLARGRQISEYGFMFGKLYPRLALTGFVIWAGATALLRVAGQHLLRPAPWTSTLALFTVSFIATAWLVRRVCRRTQIPPVDWPAAAVSLLLPMLLLDPLSSAFFPVVFPNMSPAVAGVFGGWMLCFCAGALVGVTR